MRKKKTKHGVDISQTRGMRDLSRAATWVVVMDRAQARLYEWKKTDSRLTSLNEIRFPSGRLKASELVSDRPGRSFDSWGRGRTGQVATSSRHGYGEADPSEHELSLLSTAVAQWLEAGRAANDFSELVLVAEPRCLGRLKAKLSAPVLKTIRETLQKDFSWIEEETLKHRLEDELSMETSA